MIIIQIPKIVKKGLRYKVRTFLDDDKGHKFLNTESNALHWDIVDPDNNPHNYPTKKGVYAFVAGSYHNVRSLDISVLAHV